MKKASETLVVMPDGKQYIAAGSPEDYIQDVGGVGVSDRQYIVVKTGQRIKLADILMMIPRR